MMFPHEVLMVKFLFAFAMVVLPVNAGAQTEHTVAAPVVDSSWLQADTVTKTATFQLVAGLTGLNGALNFNGFRDGGLTLTVPLGWDRGHALPESRRNAPPFRRSHPGHPSPSYRASCARFRPRFHAPAGARLVSEQTDDLRFIADKGGPT